MNFLKRLKVELPNYQKEYYQRNKIKIAKQTKVYQQTHKIEIAERKRKYFQVYYQDHKIELAKRHAEYRIKNRENLRIKGRKRIKELRESIIAYYGGKCVCCGETQFEFLAIDHVNGGGSQHRKNIKESSVCYWIKKNNYPEGFQILCHNCNMAKGFYGHCPHEQKQIFKEIEK